MRSRKNLLKKKMEAIFRAKKMKAVHSNWMSSKKKNKG